MDFKDKLLLATKKNLIEWDYVDDSTSEILQYETYINDNIYIIFNSALYDYSINIYNGDRFIESYKEESKSKVKEFDNIIQANILYFHDSHSKNAIDIINKTLDSKLEEDIDFLNRIKPVKPIATTEPLPVHRDNHNKKMQKIKIELDLDNCVECYYCESKRTENAGCATDYFCKKANLKIMGYIEYPSEIEPIPRWCPCLEIGVDINDY
jgi:hypothetical protein